MRIAKHQADHINHELAAYSSGAEHADFMAQ
ncbi:MAG: hypothetical protein RL014_3 [Pseudomonadota bacterium]|jgi:hypothetical protein